MRVLVVEDEQDMAESLAWGLEAEGYVVDVAGDGVEGLWKARETSPDVIILDVMLPGMDGYQVCRRLREQGRWVPILMLTAMDEDLDHAEGLDSGADDYLAKPFSYPVLLAHLRALTRRWTRPDGPSLATDGSWSSARGRSPCSSICCGTRDGSCPSRNCSSTAGMWPMTGACPSSKSRSTG
jgi:DNA-binding response OmpR family regulator